MSSAPIRFCESHQADKRRHENSSPTRASSEWPSADAPAHRSRSSFALNMDAANHPKRISWSRWWEVWILTLIAAYLVGAVIWSGITLWPPIMPTTLYYAPTGLLRLAGIPVYLIPDPRPPEIQKLLPVIHFIFWPCFVLLLLLLRRISNAIATILYCGFATLLLANLGGCLLVRGL